MVRKILVVACLCLPLLSFTKKKKKAQPVKQSTTDRTDYKQMMAPLPEFRLVELNGTVITNKTLKNDANLFVMIFNPVCEHCEDMTGALEKDIKLFKKSKLVLVAASSMKPYLELFQKELKTAEYPMIMVGLDSSKIMDRLFNYNMLPQINIYNHERRLIKTFNAQETVDSLREYIE